MQSRHFNPRLYIVKVEENQEIQTSSHLRLHVLFDLKLEV